MVETLTDTKQQIQDLRSVWHIGPQRKNRMKPWRDLAPRTRKKYLAIVAKMLQERLPMPADYARTHRLSKSQYQFCRAAILQVCSEKLRKIMVQTDIDKAELLTTAALGEAAFEGEYAAPRYQTKSQKRNSKKYNLPKKNGWFEAVLNELPTAHYQTAWAISYCVGLRPDELVSGVKIVHTNGRLSIRIWGSKRSKDNGSTWRRIELSSSDPTTLIITQKMSGQVLNFRLNPNLKEPAAAFAMAVRRAAARAGLDADISPYVCRHSFAGRLKKAQFDQVEIAMAMGQRSTATQGNYGGHGAIGSGGLPVKIINSGEEIRQPVNRLNEIKRKTASMC